MALQTFAGQGPMTQSTPKGSVLLSPSKQSALVCAKARAGEMEPPLDVTPSPRQFLGHFS